MESPLQRLRARLAGAPLGGRLARGAFWVLCGAAISKGLGVAASVVVARFLGQEAFGQLGMVQGTVGMLGTFAGFGLSLTATKHVAELRDRDPARAGRILSLAFAVSAATGLAMAAGLFAGAPWLARHVLAAPELGPLLGVMAVSLLLGAMNDARVGALAGLEEFRAITRVNAQAGLASFPLLTGGVWLGGLAGAMWALVAVSGLNLCLSQRALARCCREHGLPLGRPGWSRELPVLWHFSVPALVGCALVGPVNWACAALLVNQPGGYRAMGAYSAANQWFNALVFLPWVLGQVLLPMLSERLGAAGQADSRRLVRLSIRLNAAVVWPAVLVLGLLSPLVMGLYGPGFRAEWPVLAVSLLGAGLVAVQFPAGQVVSASGRMWLGALLNSGWALAFLGFTAALIGWGAFGLAFARSAAYLLHGGWTFAVAAWILRTHPAPPVPPLPSVPAVAETTNPSLT